MQAYHFRIVVHRNQHSPPLSHTAQDWVLPASLWQPLPAQTPKHTARRNALFNPAHKDYRFGPIRIDWVDLENMSKPILGGKEKQLSARGASAP